MANVTFSSPVMSKDVTVYAVAGDRGTILSLAKSHNIPIPFDCGDGDCGSCLVEVKHFHPRARYGIALTDKEKEMLRQLGKITRDEIRDAEVNDMPPRYRLACQCFVRNEDIMVIFEGDETLPKKGPHITHAANRFTGGIEIGSLSEFLSYAVRVEEDAAFHYDRLSKAMEECGNGDVATLFKQLSDFSKLHLAEARARAGKVDAKVVLPPDYVWPDNATPERPSLLAADPAMTRLDGLKVALQGEQRGFEFYRAVVAKTKSADIAAAASEFFKEEAEHVKILEAWITREEWTIKQASTAKA